MNTHLINTKIDNNTPSFKAEFYQLSDEPKMTPFARRDFYKIWLVLNQGILCLSNQRISITRPALIFLHPLTPYSFEPEEKDRSGYWCIFTETFFTSNTRIPNIIISSLFNIDIPKVFFPDNKNLLVIQFIFGRIVSDFNSDYALKYQGIRSYLNLLTHEGMKMQPFLMDNQRQNAASHILAQFLNILEKQFPVVTPAEPVKLKKPGDFAAELAIHVNHLNAVVHQVTGKSTSTHIAERMVQESSALLRFSDWSIADIAYSLGFEYPNHFNTFFKKHTGITPLSLRK